MRVISLVSGGLDSILATDELLKQGNEVLMLFVNYNQAQLLPERKAVEYFYGLFEETYVRGTVTNQVSLLEQTVYLGGTKKVESAWGRTLLLLGCALSYNYSQRSNYYDAIGFGGHQGDKGPDIKPENREAFERVVDLSSKGTIKLLYPIEEMDSVRIGEEFKTRQLPIRMAYSCYWDPPCGYRSKNDSYRCPGCRRKAISMRVAGCGNAECDLPNSWTTTYQSPLAEKLDY
jgi:7-cyano-7-deazaguanine synthase in queuosine biosynthesis